MVIDWISARNLLKHRMEAVFDASAFDALYPGVKAPKVYLGFPTSEPPFYCAVDTIVDTASSQDAATMGHMGVNFTLRIWICAKHTSEAVANDTLLSYLDAVFGAVMVDQRLCGTVDIAKPEVESAGTAATSDRQYIAAAEIAIRCERWSACPASLQELVAEDNDKYREEQSSESDGS